VSSNGDLLAAPGRYLRDHRLRLSLFIALAEGFLVLVGLIPKLALYALAAVALTFWFAVARRYHSPSARQASWVCAASQAIAVLVPIVWEITKLFVAVAVVVGIAAAALYFLFAEHDKA
jgi:hypothetical protein